MTFSACEAGKVCMVSMVIERLSAKHEGGEKDQS